MRKLTLAAFGTASLLAIPAFAGQSTTVQSNGTSPSGTMSSRNGSSSGTMSPQQVTQLRQNIKGQLEQDGFTNIYVVPDSFLVRADNKQGQPVVMIINPHSVFSMTQLGATAGSTGSSSGHSNSVASGTSNYEHGSSTQHHNSSSQ